ncbi:MAG TPA: hypothetical protein VFJ18_08910 [Pararhizobium sp.]|nr:hypothetical protein [Pararhizobium sp.]
MFIRTAILATAALAMTLPAAFADSYASGAVKSMKTDKGEVLTNAKGMTLYTYDKDSKGKSSCYGQCATNWPPLMASSSANPHGDFTLVTRKNGNKQWAYDGKPLYLWKNDTKPGDMTGAGMGGVWHVAMEE